MKQTIGDIRRLLEELDGEFTEVDENERAADRAQTIRLLTGMVSEWKARGYTYAQIAERLRAKGLIRVSEKTLRQVSAPARAKRRPAKAKEHEAGKASADMTIKDASKAAQTERAAKVKRPAKPVVEQQSERAGGFTPRDDSDDI